MSPRKPKLVETAPEEDLDYRLPPAHREATSGATAQAPDADADRIIEASLTDSHAAEPGKCGLCKSKMTLFPPSIDLALPLGAIVVELCDRCKTALLKLASLIGNRPVRLKLSGQSGQTDMLDDLADAVPHDDADYDGHSEAAAEAAMSPEDRAYVTENDRPVPQLTAGVP